MNRTIAAAIFALLAVTTPARAAFIDTLDASVNLNFGSTTQLTGTFDLGWLPIDSGRNYGGERVNDYYFSDPPNLSVNGFPLTLSGLPPASGPGDGTIGIFIPSGGTVALYFLGLNTNYLPPNPTFANFLLGGIPATGGTVTVLSETCHGGGVCSSVSAVPLPAAFPLFASALAGVGGFGWLKRRGKVSQRGGGRCGAIGQSQT
jgi:hypothetical protein